MTVPARVLCCTVTPHEAAMRALRAYAPQAEVVEVDQQYGYWREIRDRWTGMRDLIIVEQDIEIGPGTVAAMERCGQDWCCYAYTVFRTRKRLIAGLGCTKISAGAQRKIPASVIAEGFGSCPFCRGRGCWWHLDGPVADMLKGGAGYVPHVHGDVIHHHDYDTDEANPSVDAMLRFQEMVAAT